MSRRWTHWYLLAMLGVFPLWLGWEGYGNLTAQKYGFFVLVTGVWLAGLLVFAVREGMCVIPKTPGSRWTLILMVALCVSALCSPYGVQTLIGIGRYDGLLTWLLYGCVFLGICAYARPRLAYAYVLAGGSVLNCIAAIIQLLGYNFLWLFPNARTYYGSGVYYTGAFLGFIGNTDLLAAYFCLIIPVCFGLYVLFGGQKTAILLPAGALSWFVMLESGVSGGVVGLLMCALIAAPLILTDRERLVRGLYILALLASVSGISFTCVFSQKGLELTLCKPTFFLLFFGCSQLLLAFFSKSGIKHYANLTISFSFWKGSDF